MRLHQRIAATRRAALAFTGGSLTSIAPVVDVELRKFAFAPLGKGVGRQVLFELGAKGAELLPHACHRQEARRLREAVGYQLRGKGIVGSGELNSRFGQVGSSAFTSVNVRD